MKFVADARNWWRWHSMQALFVVGALAEWWLNSADLQAVLPTRWVATVTPVMVVAVALLRLRQQALKIPPPKPPASNDFHQRTSS